MSKEAIECMKAMLEKNRQKRPSLEAVLNMRWFEEFKKMNARSEATKDGDKFKAYALTAQDSQKVNQEIKLVKEMQV